MGRRGEGGGGGFIIPYGIYGMLRSKARTERCLLSYEALFFILFLSGFWRLFQLTHLCKVEQDF